MFDKTLRRVKIGEVGVDAGMVMVTDPCYIEGSWKREDKAPLAVGDIFLDAEGHTWSCSLHRKDAEATFGSFEEVILLEGVKATVNAHIKAGHLTKQPKVIDRTYSYNGCCSVADEYGEEGGCQLNYSLGHAGAGVCVESGYGDGCYSVYAYVNKEGRVAKIVVDFMGDLEDED